MYQNIFITQRTGPEAPTVYVWGDGEHEDAGLREYSWNDFHYAYRLDAKGQYKTIFDTRVTKIKRFQRDEPGLFESDVSRETRVLTDLYMDCDEPAKNHRVLNIDIECDSSDGFPVPEIADKQITSIAFKDRARDQYYALLLDPAGAVESKQEGNKSILSCATEYDLLETFLSIYKYVDPTIITGWHIDGFDIPYLYNRIKRVMDVEYANMLSPIGHVHYNEYRSKWQIAGVSVLDYLVVYKKFSMGEKPNYKLDSIGRAEVGRGKLEYEGTLDDLYRTDLDKFLEYNFTDVLIVEEIDEKLRYIELCMVICHMGHVPLEDFVYSSKFIEGTILTYLHRKGLIAPNKPEGGREAFDTQLSSTSQGFVGAYVKEPVKGLHEWVYSLDLTSLYPSIMIGLNISLETIAGKVTNWNVDAHIKKQLSHYSVVTDGSGKNYSPEEFATFLSTTNYCISSNGMLYRNDKLGVIPEILITWFAERVRFKTLMKESIALGDTEKADYYDRRQYASKILLNSVYGYTGLPIARFYNLGNAEAVTTTGQDVIKTTEKFLNSKYHKALGTKEDCCIYVDTDSVYFSAKKLLPIDCDADTAKAETIRIAQEHETMVNKFYDTMAMRLFNCVNHKFSIKGESVVETGFWVAKKNYALKKVFDLETMQNVPEAKQLKVTGLATVRSSFPPAFRKFMKEVLDAILAKKSKKYVDSMILKFRDELSTMDYMDVARNIGIKDIDKYEVKSETSLTSFPKGAPAHVKAALTYNRFLAHIGQDKRIEPIRSGSKIKYVYLKPNPLGIESMALKTTDDPKEVIELIQEYIDYDGLFEKELAKKLKSFYNALTWGIIPTEVNQLAYEFFTFD